MICLLLGSRPAPVACLAARTALAGAAVVDRLVYTGKLVEFNGPSYRMENVLMLGKGKNRPQVQ